MNARSWNDASGVSRFARRTRGARVILMLANCDSYSTIEATVPCYRNYINRWRRGRGGDRRGVSSQRDAARAWAGGGFGVVRAAVACPGDGLEPLLVDVLAAVLAQAEGAGVDARQCQADFL